MQSRPFKNGGRISGKRRKPASSCGVCGLEYGEFAASGRLGCPHCYKAFRGRLESVFETRYSRKNYAAAAALPKWRAAGSKIPLKTEELRRELALAVSSENFERAALLRDILRSRTGD